MQRVLCKCAESRAACAGEHPSDDPFHPNIKLNKSADRRVSSCSLPPKATVAIAATRLSHWQQRENHTNKQHTANEGLNFSTSLRKSMIYLWLDSVPQKLDLSCHNSMRSQTAFVLHHYRHVTFSR